jgi:hypothetical protein
MKNSPLNDWLTLTANLAVVAGIIFLAVEIRQNTAAVRLSTTQFMSAELADFNRTWMEKDLSEIFVQNGIEGYDSLTDVQKRQWYGLSSSYLQIQQGLFYQWRAGSLEQGVWNGRHRQLVQLMQADNFKDVWSQWGDGAGDEFRDYVETIVIPEGEKSAE